MPASVAARRPGLLARRHLVLVGTRRRPSLEIPIDSADKLLTLVAGDRGRDHAERSPSSLAAGAPTMGADRRRGSAAVVRRRQALIRLAALSFTGRAGSCSCSSRRASRRSRSLAQLTKVSRKFETLRVEVDAQRSPPTWPWQRAIDARTRRSCPQQRHDGRGPKRVGRAAQGGAGPRASAPGAGGDAEALTIAAGTEMQGRGASRSRQGERSAALHGALAALENERNPQKRGYEFERFLVELFRAFDIGARASLPNWCRADRQWFTGDATT